MGTIFYKGIEYGGAGHEILYGTSVPSSSLGTSGDMYCRLDGNGNLIEEYIKLGNNWTIIPKSDAVLGTKTITTNGTYTASTENLDGYSSIEVDVPTSGGGVTAKYLARGHCDVDSGETEVNKQLTMEWYNDYQNYLSYNSTNNEIVVQQDFEAILVPYIYCYQQGSSAPQMDVMINGNRYIEAMRGINTVGTTQGIAGWMDLPSEFDSVRISLSQGDTIALQKYSDTGWTGFNIKIYKLCGVNSNISNFMDSINTLSDTSSYTNVSLID